MEARAAGAGQTEARMGVRALVVVIAVILTMLTAAGRDAWAGVPSEQLRTQIERAVKVLEDPSHATESRTVERRATTRRIANDLSHFSQTTRPSPGPARPHRTHT